MRNIASMNEAEQNNPVAVVYYRCELQGTKKCTPRGNLYYVHNGVALEHLPRSSDHSVWISHVATWPHTNKVCIFGHTEAVEAAQKGKGGTDCCGSEEQEGKSKDIWRPWVWVAIYPYMVDHQPIAWMFNNNLKDPHNGVLDRLECSTTTGGCTLHYWHYKNNSIDSDPNKHENSRTVYDSTSDGSIWKVKFQPEKGNVAVNLGPPSPVSLTIATQPPPVTELSPCP